MITRLKQKIRRKMFEFIMGESPETFWTDFQRAKRNGEYVVRRVDKVEKATAAIHIGITNGAYQPDLLGGYAQGKSLTTYRFDVRKDGS